MGLDAAAAGQMPPVGGGGGGGQQDIMPMMEHMMQALLSKDLLYPAVKDMADKFPEWLADNRQKLSEAEFDRCDMLYCTLIKEFASK